MNIYAGLDLLNRDEKMRVLIKKFGWPDFDPKQDYFQSLLRSIVFQQLSGKAANTIYGRLINLIPKHATLSPEEVLKMDKDDMRGAGLSFQKISYVKNLSKFFGDNTFNKKEVERMTDEEISIELTQIKGIGQWTVDMFLMFTLNRPDIMPYTDLGIQKVLSKFSTWTISHQKKKWKLIPKNGNHTELWPAGTCGGLWMMDFLGS